MAEVTSRGRVLVTGANGFAGRALVPALFEAGWSVRACGRQPRPPTLDPGVEYRQCDLVASPDFEGVVHGVRAIVHLAARVHVMKDAAHDPLREFRLANVQVTERLAAAAAQAGVRELIFASSVKVNGEGKGNAAYTEADPAAPADSYAQSKLEAELALRGLADRGLCTTVLRPPLMYGPGVKGNFARLVRLVERGIPLPLASATNRRSLLFIGNFCSAVLAALQQPRPGHRLYLLSDGEDVSVSELIHRIARVLHRPARLFPFPSPILRWGAAILGMGGEATRLTEPLLVNPARIRAELSWTAPWSLDEALRMTLRTTG